MHAPPKTRPARHDRAAGAAGLTERQRGEALARFYDLDVLDLSYDAELYQQLAHGSGGPILELAVGSGRLAIPLALAGHRVLGVDHDAAMLERAWARWDLVRGPIERERLSLHEGDFTAFRASECFAMVFIAVNTFLLAEDDQARVALLQAMREQLQPGGFAVIEVSTPDDDELADFDGRLQLEWLRHEPESGDLVAKLVSARHDTEHSSVSLCQVFEWTPAHGGPLARVTRTDTLHLVVATRLADLALESGYDRVDLWGDHLSIPYGSGSHRAILVARLV
jgi:SAM-dependent methyltransferase